VLATNEGILWTFPRTRCCVFFNGRKSLLMDRADAPLPKVFPWWRALFRRKMRSRFKVIRSPGLPQSSAFPSPKLFFFPKEGEDTNLCAALFASLCGELRGLRSEVARWAPLFCPRQRTFWAWSAFDAPLLKPSYKQLTSTIAFSHMASSSLLGRSSFRIVACRVTAKSLFSSAPYVRPGPRVASPPR